MTHESDGALQHCGPYGGMSYKNQEIYLGIDDDQQYFRFSSNNRHIHHPGIFCYAVGY